MRWFASCLIVAACANPPAPVEPTQPDPADADDDPPDTSPAPPAPVAPPYDPTHAGKVVSKLTEYAFDGGWIEFEMRRDGNRVFEIAYDHYAVAVTVAWQFGALANLEPTSAMAGVVVLPAAKAPNGRGAPVVIATYSVLDPTKAYHRELSMHARWGDPRSTPTRYAYRLPFPTGSTFSVLQGFHGTFSHRGSNEFAVDFDCPQATRVLAARAGTIVASNAAAQWAGTKPEFLDYRHTNFVIVMHDDGTLGEYMHLSPSGVEVVAGQRVTRGQELGLSGNTGFSTTPHLHFQVMTAAEDGIAAHSFPFELAIAPATYVAPVQGKSYTAWE